MSGGLWDEMEFDGVFLNEIFYVGNIVMVYYGVNVDFGEFWWENCLGKE